ncbi:hypothetical protein [Chamaesiphon sp. VAR_69_metabat_338]|uniref:hypothetical protein n=1 Tax=Chamaesiphon sp. VAR_69_metabat_338 TaxID=2964704 RepID=UPI00286E3B19|nr:hypothetical protein [Chamaesiphon sp. VAR_69_metabat_338]
MLIVWGDGVWGVRSGELTDLNTSDLLPKYYAHRIYAASLLIPTCSDRLFLFYNGCKIPQFKEVTLHT